MPRSLEKETAPTPVFLPGKSHGQRSLIGYSPWGHKESDTTEHTHKAHMHMHICKIILRHNHFTVGSLLIKLTTKSNLI